MRADRNAQTASAPVTTNATADAKTGTLAPATCMGQPSNVRVACATAIIVKTIPETSSYLRMSGSSM